MEHKEQSNMDLYFNTEEHQKFLCLSEIMNQNNDAVSLLSSYLTECPDFITPELIHNFCAECEVSEMDAFTNLLIAACGLDPENNTNDRQLAINYILPSIRKLDPETYKANLYYQNIHIPEVHTGNWDLKYENYKPYEAFVCNDLIVEDNFKEIPRLGFFDTEFSFPAVLQDGCEWMAIKPNEIETMQQAINQATGNVITFGLGLGYYAYMVSEKNTVENITIIEKDNDVISLFKTYILPQFSNQQKVSVIQADAFEYVSQIMPEKTYDYAFVDLWHDVSDGYPLYIQMKKLEALNPEARFFYWIETSLLSHFRWELFHQFEDALTSVTTDKTPKQSGLSYDRLLRELRDPFRPFQNRCSFQ